MTLAPVRRPTCEARPAAWKASPITYTPPWKYRTTWRASIPSMVISAVGTPPSAAGVTVTPGGSGCAEANSASRCRCSLTSLSNGKGDCRKIASRFSRCSVLTEDLPSIGLAGQCTQVGSPVNPLLKLPAGRPATTRLAARQVRRRHRITVIRATSTTRNSATSGSTPRSSTHNPWRPVIPLRLRPTGPLSIAKSPTRPPRVPLYNPRDLIVLADRVGNYQFHPYWNLLIDQLWVR